MDAPSIAVNIIDKVKKFLSENKEVLDNGSEIMNSILEIMLSNTVDFINVVSYTFLARQTAEELRKKAPALYPTWRFWNNIDKFFHGGVLSDNDKQKLIDKLTVSKKPNDTGKELIGIISKVETDNKMAYILNTTKALANAHITLPEYFRICHVVMNTLEEDLQFLKDHINDETVPYSIEISGLMTTGLAYPSSIREEEFMNYSFSTLAKFVNDYALVSEMNVTTSSDINKPPQTNFVATDEEVSGMFDGVSCENG